MTSGLLSDSSIPAGGDALLRSISRRVLWLSCAMIDAANHARNNDSGIKVGGHQASSASMVDIMVALWFHSLTSHDRVSVKPHAAPVLHAINYLLGGLDPHYLSTLRARGGLQSYPSRRKDPDAVDFSTGSVGIGATATLWAALARRYCDARFADMPPGGRFIGLLGDAELDEGAVWEALADPNVPRLGEVLWVVDLNRQSLDRVVPDMQIQRLQGMFEACGWQVVTLKWGRRLTALFDEPGGSDLRIRLESMSNEEYQWLLRADAKDLPGRLLGGNPSHAMQGLLEAMWPSDVASALRDLGGHDVDLLVDTFAAARSDRPTVVFAYTTKGRGLPIEGHPSNHSALLTEAEMAVLADSCGTSTQSPWAAFEDGSPEAALCARRARELERAPLHAGAQSPGLQVPTSLGHPYRKPISTQTALGRILADLARDAPSLASRLVTCSPDVASSTNLGGWINKAGVWTATDRFDWFADDPKRILKWSERSTGQHIELGIAEVNLVGLLAEIGSAWSRWQQRLIPLGTLYDPFVGRALEPWSFGIYAGGQSILIGTPSGVTLAPEGGAHQSIGTPSIGLEQPECVAWEPAFAQDLEWCLLHAMTRVGIPGGTSAYFRLSTRPVDPSLAQLPTEPSLVERRRRQAVAGGYRVSGHHPREDSVTLIGVGAIMPEVLEAAAALGRAGHTAGVVCLTSPDLIFRAVQARGRREGPVQGVAILDELFPPTCPAPLVTVHDGHPHTLAFLGSVRDDAIRSLGVTSFGQSSDLADAYRLHGIDHESIADAAIGLLNR